MDHFSPSLKQLIFTCINQSGYLPLKRHELAGELNLKTSQRQELRTILRELEEEGKNYLSAQKSLGTSE